MMKNTITKPGSHSAQLLIEEIQDLDPCSERGRQWEELVGANPASGFMQSLHWARFKQESGQDAIHLIIRPTDSDKILGGAMLYTCPDEKRPTVLICPYGPVLPWQDGQLAAQCLRLIIARSTEIAERINAVCLRIEPRVLLPAPSLLHEFARAPVNLVPSETLLVDLSCGLDSLLKDMKPKCRYNISLAERRGVTVRELPVQDDSASTFYKLLEEASDRDDFYLEPESFFARLLKIVGPTGMLKLFVAEHEGDNLGCLLLVTHGDKATYLYGGISNIKRQLMPGYALQWHAMRAAKEARCKSYDFYGYDQFQKPGHPYARFSRFKSGFGGTPVRCIGAQDYMFTNKLVDNIIDFFRDLS